MKPTQEQVVQWAREVELFATTSILMKFAALAYEAGRKDENEACAVEVASIDADGWEFNMAAIIRARRRIMTDRELMQQALDALEEAADHIGCPDDDDAIGVTRKALRARLAQPEQEPVAWITDGGKGELWWHQSVKFDDDGNLIGENPDDIPLYTAPPQRGFIGLTDEEIQWCYEEGNPLRAIEAKLKEKNT